MQGVCFGASFSQSQIPSPKSPMRDENNQGSNYGDVGGLATFGRVDRFVADYLALTQRFETAHDNCRVVYENIDAVFRFDEPVPFGIVEPLYFTCCRIHC